MLKNVIKLAEPIVKTGCQLMEKALGKPCERVGELVADQIAYWKWSNCVKIAEKASRVAREKGIPQRFLPPEFSIPFFEAAANIANDNLQSMWANLLASALKDDTNARASFSRLLAELDTHDATILSKLSKENLVIRQCLKVSTGFGAKQPPSMQIGKYELSDSLDKQSKAIALLSSVSRLSNFGLCVVKETRTQSTDEFKNYIKWKTLEVHPTIYARNFLSLCGVETHSKCLDPWSHEFKDRSELWRGIGGVAESQVSADDVERIIEESTESANLDIL